MIVELVTEAEASAHLRLDADESTWLAVWIPAVSGAIMSWLKEDRRIYLPLEDSSGIIEDSNGDPLPSETIHPTVKAACLVELASQYRFRDGDGVAMVPPHWGHGHQLCAGATALLVAFRKSLVT